MRTQKCMTICDRPRVQGDPRLMAKHSDSFTVITTVNSVPYSHIIFDASD